MAFFPIFTDLEGQTVLLVGSGRHIEEKIERLRPFGARLRRVEDGFRVEDLTPRPVFVVASGEDPEVDRQVSEACREQGIPVNVVDVPELCTFYFPALLREGALTAGFCTSGKSPGAAALLRDRTRSLVPERLDAIMDWSLALRPWLSERFPEGRARRAASRALLERAFALDRPLTEEETASVAAEVLSEAQSD